MVDMYSKTAVRHDSAGVASKRVAIATRGVDTGASEKKLEDAKSTSSDSQKASNTKHKMCLKSTGQIEIKPSNKVISVFLSKHDQSLVKYQVKSASWVFDNTLYDDLVKELRKSNVTHDNIPHGTMQAVRKKIPATKFNLSGGIYEILLPFQREGVHFALNRGGRIILADDMGLGKTIQALAIANYYKSEWPLLIIAPASLLDNWQNSVRAFLDMECSVARRQQDLCGDICVISYDMAAKSTEKLQSAGYQVIIVDECHYLKSVSTKRTNNILPHLQKATRLVLISGTPALSRPVELYPLISAVAKDMYPNFFEYGVRYCNGRKVGNWYDYRGCSNAEELFFVLNRALMIRRTKDEVMSELPPKRRRHVVLSLKSTCANIEVDEVEKPSVDIIKMYVEAAEIKVDAVIEYVSNVLEKNIKFLVYAHHAIMIDSLEDFLRKKNVGFIKIDGSTPSSQRQPLCDTFQTNDSVRVALLSLTAASTGLTLTAGKAVIFAELYWNPGTLLQAEDRIHRIGQSCSVDIHYLLAKDTVDEYVWPKLLKKLNVLESLGIGTNELKNVKETKNHQDRLDFYLKGSKQKPR